jgi:hypothetical protein
MFIKGLIHFILINEWFIIDTTKLWTISEDVTLVEGTDQKLHYTQSTATWPLHNTCGLTCLQITRQ